MTFRFIHSSDLHLGKRFGQFTGDLPAKLREARHAAIGRLAEQARNHDASTILLAGDTFDTETPASDMVRQALAEMGHHASVRWVILPGNHDSLQAAQLWSTLCAQAPRNVTLALNATPLELVSGVTLLPAPCTTRRPGRDLSEWMDNAVTGDGTIRIGLAHGAVTSFSEEGAGLDVIAPDRARRAGLSYLALGDWHGGVEIDPRTRYSGTPEPDRFKHDRPGEALLVSIEGAAALPDVTVLETGTFSWRTLALDLLDGEDAVALMQSLLPEARARRQVLVTLVAGGRARLEARAALARAVENARPDFAWLSFDDAALATECDAGDLDAIDRAGALREAADALLAEAGDTARSAEEREIARAALGRLYAYAQVVA
ncbi:MULTISPECIES: metallophosphoesterase family protein [Phyllobacteriaceae]|jgi:DNA repair exonuclease SbcCD nuclease subunit|uniref:Exonuclease n=1 Tax=Mesorhizobium hungaricum TaxID=1566387 RepID=A0A1C2EEB7_9HYPH|nr:MULTISPECIES: DNA repair exonuclease [Mesorhizobium]MBN9237775.1 DNA repair exonuclease [Mesorhizobium sp.]MDQ0327726.1 DNA repair exonuclease SbcCD nuclease subunit [Mesorhizobium sp. YL-MeA3-2017]OCX25303.1 exonuclease [Mesorhizobium hungaricum]